MSETPVIDFLSRRRSVLAGMMSEPGPDADQLETLLAVAMRVPDHGKLTPWRFILFEGSARDEAGELLAAAFAAATPDARAIQIEAERARLARAPLVIAVVSAPKPHPKIPEWEQVLSAGAVCMSLVSAATAMGFGAQWLTEWLAYDENALAALGLGEGEKLAGLVYIGTAMEPPVERARPEVAELTRLWTAPPD